MSKFVVYQAVIDDERYVEVNARGWEGVEWGKAYLNVTNFANEKNVAERVNAAAAFGLYKKTWVVEAETVGDVFTLTNIGLDGEVVSKDKYAKSGSVGDVVISVTESGLVGNVCLSFGWAELTAKQVGEFLVHAA